MYLNKIPQLVHTIRLICAITGSYYGCLMSIHNHGIIYHFICTHTLTLTHTLPHRTTYINTFEICTTHNDDE